MEPSTPIFDELAAEHPEVVTAMTRERWSYSAALARANTVIVSQKKKKRTRKSPRDGETA